MCVCTNTVRIYIRDRKKIHLCSARRKAKDQYSKRPTMTSKELTSWMGQRLEAGIEQKDRAFPKQRTEPSPEENTTRLHIRFGQRCGRCMLSHVQWELI